MLMLKTFSFSFTKAPWASYEKLLLILFCIFLMGCDNSSTPTSEESQFFNSGARVYQGEVSCPIRRAEFDLLQELKWARVSDLPVYFNWEGCPRDLISSLNRALAEALSMWSSIPTSTIKMRVGGHLEAIPLDSPAENLNQLKGTSCGKGDTLKGYYSLQENGLPRKIPLVVCKSPFPPIPCLDYHKDSVYAYTLLFKDDNTRDDARDDAKDDEDEIAFSTVVLNTDPEGEASIINLPYEHLLIIMAHELGHVLGLNHSRDKNSIMVAQPLAFHNQSFLFKKDVRSVTYLYPQSQKVNSSCIH